MLYSILQAPAETTRYMVAGYTVIFSIMLLYILSMVVRSRKLERDLELLNEMEQEQK
jgi:CcmD family protein